MVTWRATKLPPPVGNNFYFSFMTQITFHFPKDYFPSLCVTCPHSHKVPHLLVLGSILCPLVPTLPISDPFAFIWPGHRDPLSRVHNMLEILTLENHILNSRCGPWPSQDSLLRGSPTPLVSNTISEELLFRSLAITSLVLLTLWGVCFFFL